MNRDLLFSILHFFFLMGTVCPAHPVDAEDTITNSIVYVRSGGLNYFPCGLSPALNESCASLTLALNQTLPSSRVFVCPGFYESVGEVDDRVMGVSIIGISLTDCGMSKDSENSSSVATIRCLENRILEEHPIIIKNNSVVLLQNLLIDGCNSTIVGSSNLTVIDVRFENNYGFSGGALEVNGNGIAKLYLRGCSFIGNSAQLHGGAVSIDNSYFSIESCIFAFNTATGLESRVEGSVGGRGGALYITRNLVDGVGLSFLSNCTFLENKATLNGGALFLSVLIGFTNVSFCKFINNTIVPIPVCLSGDCLIRGGAIYSSNAPLRIFDSEFRSNAIYTVEVDQVCAYD